MVAGLCGGSVFPLIKIAESNEIPKFAYIFWEAVIVVFLLSAIALSRSERSLFETKEYRYYGFCAITNILIPQSLSFIIAEKLDASIFSLLVVLTPTFVYVLTVFFGNQRLALMKTLGISLGLVGALFLFVPLLLSKNASANVGMILLAFLVPIDYSLNRFFASRLKPTSASPYRLAIGLWSFVAVGSGLLLLSFQQFYVPFLDSDLRSSLALVAHAIVMVVFYIVFFILAGVGSLRNSLSFYVAPVVGITWGILLFDERLTPFILVAALLVFIGVYIVTLEREPEKLR